MSHPSAGLPDIQKTGDTRGVALYRVGVSGIRLPVKLKRRDPMSSNTSTVSSEFELSCSVPERIKGTHMSRFTEVLNRFVGPSSNLEFSGALFTELLQELAIALESNVIHVRMVADYFVEQPAPVSGRSGVAPLKVVLEGELTTYPDEHTPDFSEVCFTYVTGIDIDGKTCCPCSREISGYDPETGMGRGAHAQRGNARIRVFHSKLPEGQILWFEDLVAVAWAAFSSPVYSVLKRVDEKFVTEAAYANPKFVEDVARDLILGLRTLGDSIEEVSGFQVKVENSESIHYHNAYAITRETRNPLYGSKFVLQEDQEPHWEPLFGIIYPF